MRLTSITLTLFCGFVGLAADAAHAQLPADRTLKLAFHETPSDPESPIVLIVELELSAEDIDGDSVGWSVEQLRVAELDDYGFTVGEWIQTEPTVATGDGLWWVEHDDAQEPDNGEFVILPLMAGTAVSVMQNQPALDFFMEGVDDDPPGGAPYPVTSVLDVALVRTDESVLREAETEPAALDGWVVQ